MDPLRTELKNFARFTLGTKLYLRTQKGKEAIKTQGFQKEIRVAVDCKKIKMKDAKGCRQLSSNYTFFSDIWFSGVNTSEEVRSLCSC